LYICYGIISCGSDLITTDLGALPETCCEFPIYIPYTQNKPKLALQLAECILQTKRMLSQDLTNPLKFQQEYYKRFYDWKYIGNHWNNFLKGAINVKRNK
jgi:hypothetical protein